jgi:WD40 repeat protein
MQYAISALKSVLPASLSRGLSAGSGAPPSLVYALPAPTATAARPRVVAALAGHDDRVWMVAWHPSGQVLASCSGDKTVRIWANTRPTSDASTGWRCVATLQGEHRRTVRCVSWSPDGSRLACSSFDATVTVWAWAKGSPFDTGVFDLELVTQLDGHENEVKCVAWYAPSSAASASAGGAADDDEDEGPVPLGPAGASQPACLATCSRDKTVWVWEDVADGDAEAGGCAFECAGVLEGHSQDVKFVRWLPPACATTT